MQPSSYPLARRILGTLPVGIPLEGELARPLSPLVPQVDGGRDALFLTTLRANLHAAARHAALGHTGPSFRECPGPACREASKLIPELDPTQQAATDAELDAILDDVLASLEREGTPLLVVKPS